MRTETMYHLTEEQLCQALVCPEFGAVPSGADFLSQEHLIQEHLIQEHLSQCSPVHERTWVAAHCVGWVPRCVERPCGGAFFAPPGGTGAWFAARDAGFHVGLAFVFGGSWGAVRGERLRAASSPQCSREVR